MILLRWLSCNVHENGLVGYRTLIYSVQAHEICVMENCKKLNYGILESIHET